MNFFLGASIIILLLFPGLVFRLLYLHGRHTRGFSFGIIEELLLSLVPTLLIHLVCLPLTLIFKFLLPALYLMVISHPDGGRSLDLFSLSWFIVYCLGTYLLAGLCGIGMRWLAMRLNWDINIPIFRIYNEWYYLLRGMIVEADNRRRVFVEVENIKVDAVVDIGGKGYIYSGRINDFVLSKSEGFDRIYLRDTIRRPLERTAAKKTAEPAPPTNSDLIQSLEKLMNERKEIVFPVDNEEQMSQLSSELQDYLQEDEAYFIPGDRFCLIQ